MEAADIPGEKTARITRQRLRIQTMEEQMLMFDPVYRQIRFETDEAGRPAGKAVETILVMVDAEETLERMQDIIKKYIPEGQRTKAAVMERNAEEDWNSFRRRFAACRI